MTNGEAINRERMFEPLLQADPTFDPSWRAFLADYKDEPELPLYLALSDLACHLIAQLDRGETARFDAVFDIVERWCLRGDHYVRVAATVGLLEDLQNGNLYERAQIRPSDFEPWLRPVSKRQWEKVYAFWSRGELITDVEL